MMCQELITHKRDKIITITVKLVEDISNLNMK